MMNGDMNGFVPPADYSNMNGRSPPELPFIPPPDYAKTMKYVKNQAKEMNGHLVPKPPPRQRPGLNGVANGIPNGMPNGMSNGVSNGHYVQNGDINRISPEPTELPQQQKSDPKERILKMLRNQGVPVFPGLAAKQEPVEKSEPPIAPPQNPLANVGPTKAYLKHLENHQKFDTLNSFRGMDNCPICKEMQEEIDLLAQGRARKDHHHRSVNNGHSHDSLITSGKAFRPPLDALVEDEMEPEEDADAIVMPSYRDIPTKDYFSQPSTSARNEKPVVNGSYANCTGQDMALTARPLGDWEAESANQLSVKFSETLKVLEMGVNWWRCENSLGEVGWVPATQLYLMPTGYY